MFPSVLPPLSPQVMERTAPHFSQFPEFCGYRITAFCVSRGMDAEKLAAHLGTTLAHLQHMAGVFAPRPGPHWAADLRMLADRYGIDAGKLAVIFRQD